MRSYYLDYAAQLVQKGPPKAAPQEEAGQQESYFTAPHAHESQPAPG